MHGLFGVLAQFLGCLARSWISDGSELLCLQHSAPPGIRSIVFKPLSDSSVVLLSVACGSLQFVIWCLWFLAWEICLIPTNRISGGGRFETVILTLRPAPTTASAAASDGLTGQASPCVAGDSCGLWGSLETSLYPGFNVTQELLDRWKVWLSEIKYYT